MAPTDNAPLAAAREAALRQLFRLTVWWCWPLLAIALVLRWEDPAYRASTSVIVIALPVAAFGLRRSGWPAERRAAYAITPIAAASLLVMLMNAPRALNLMAALVVMTMTVLFSGTRRAAAVLGLYVSAAALNLVLTANGWVTPLQPDYEQPASYRVVVLLVGFSCFWFSARVLQMTIRIYREAQDAAEARLQAMLDAQREVEVLQRRELVNVVTTGFAHDLTNAVQAMSITASLLEDATSPVEAREAARDLRRVADDVAGRMRALLAVGRDGDKEPGATTISRLLARLELVLPPLVGRQVTLELRNDGDGPIALRQARLEQALVNLALNARDAMPAGGVLRVHARASEGGTWIDVSDTGTGIAEELLPRIWEPYVTTKAPERGTGLGLAVVRRIVEGAGGRVTVRSTVGQGSTFSLWIPGASAPDAP